jgi:hypothetical protein
MPSTSQAYVQWIYVYFIPYLYCWDPADAPLPPPPV